MSKFLLFLFLFCFSYFFSQDTTHLVSYNDGGYRLEIRSETDTIYTAYYSKEKLESTIKRDKKSGNYIYKRYYWNGNRMWERELKNGLLNGKSTYYSKKGNKVAEFLYEQGEITDTLFLARDIYFILGNLRFSSTIYGGVENEDGTSNVQHNEGTLQHVTMKFATIKNKKTDIPQEFLFTSDHEGDYFVVVKPGYYGLFDTETKTQDITINQYLSPNNYNKSAQASWSLPGPLIIDKHKQINIISLLHSFEGYAP